MNCFSRFSCLLLLSAFACGSLWAGGPPDYDTVKLKDGRVVKGQVVEERTASVVVLVKGVRRTFERAFVAKISYGEGADMGAGADLAGPMEEAAPEARSAASAPEAGADHLLMALSERYRVPVSDVAWVRGQGVPDADLPVVFFVAAKAGVAPRRVVQLYLQGWSWDEIDDYFQIQPAGGYSDVYSGAYDPYYFPDPAIWYGWSGYDGAYAGGWNQGYGGWHGRGYAGSYNGTHSHGWSGGSSYGSGGSGRIWVGGARASGAGGGGSWGAASAGRVSVGSAGAGGGGHSSGGSLSHDSRHN